MVNNDADLYQLMQKPLQALLSGTEKTLFVKKSVCIRFLLTEKQMLAVNSRFFQ
ncbi:hypothetical protein MUS_1415 [Bacillus velezensis YAU B9601-Y2]|uniref:Uncharacterized protein n=1 Tax=Bacillus amyloliquefaciens (strain Y2) TaxID=1155777 RepID=I2C454_BACAY|nr:hypothetical protein MUS_1415 [Bacillus velezensis YAU B9601-Y2]